MTVVFTAPGVLSFAGGLLMIAAIVEFIFATAFCTKPAPNWIRQARTIGLGIAGARLLTRDNASIDIDAWFVTGLWLYLAFTQSVVAGYTVANIQPPDSEMCGPKTDRKVGNVVKLVLFLLGFILFMGGAGVAGAQEKPTPAAGGSSSDFEVVVGDYAYPLDPNDPIQGCVTAVTADQDGETTLTYRLFVREQSSDGPIFNSVGVYTDDAVGFPADIEINDCFGV